MKKFHKIINTGLASLLVFSMTTPVFACTGLYVGEEQSDNGSTYYGRSEDLSDNQTKIFGISEEKEYEKGTKYKDADGFEMEMPEETYRYTYVRDSNEATPEPVDQDGNVVGQAYGEVGINEHGVGMTATVSTYYNDKAKEADPLVDGGFTEVSLQSVTLGQSKSAREGIENVAKIIDEHGAGENNSLMIGDKDEVWHMDILSGHQYLAMKMPKDKVVVQPNMFVMRGVDLNDKENVIYSKDLLNLAENNGFLVKDENGNIDITRTYAAEVSEGSATRYWQGLNYIDPELTKDLKVEDITNDSGNVDMFRDANRKLTTLEVLNILKQRGIGTEYDSTKDPKVYPIGNKNQMEVHVLEQRKDMPKELATIQWLGIADAAYTVYVPYYAAMITDVHEKYKPEVTKIGEDNFNGLFNELNTIGMSNYNLDLDAGMQAYIEKVQQSIIDQQKAVDKEMLKYFEKDPELARKKATEISIDLADQVYNIMARLRDEVKAYVENGDHTKPFKVSDELGSMLPLYEFAKEDKAENKEESKEAKKEAKEKAKAEKKADKEAKKAMKEAKKTQKKANKKQPKADVKKLEDKKASDMNPKTGVVGLASISLALLGSASALAFVNKKEN